MRPPVGARMPPVWMGMFQVVPVAPAMEELGWVKATVLEKVSATVMVAVAGVPTCQPSGSCAVGVLPVQVTEVKLAWMV